MRKFLITWILTGILFVCSCGVRGEDNTQAIQNGKTVRFDYILTVDGKIFDTSKKGDPLQYTHGKGDIVVGLEKGLEGLRVDDEKLIVVKPEEGYGVIDSNAIKIVPRATLPPNIDLKVGMMLQVPASGGRMLTAIVRDTQDDAVALDFNHPLAGKTLYFQVKIVSME